MTNDERFEAWWSPVNRSPRPDSWGLRDPFRRIARLAWHCASLSEADRATCIEALASEEADAEERLRTYKGHVTYERRARHDLARFRAVRERLER